MSVIATAYVYAREYKCFVLVIREDIYDIARSGDRVLSGDLIKQNCEGDEMD